MLILERNQPVIAEYLKSLYKSASGVEQGRGPARIRSVRTRVPSGKFVALLVPGSVDELGDALLESLANQLKSLDMPTRVQRQDRELSSHDFFLHLDQVQKALIIHFMERKEGEPIIECSSKEFSKTLCLGYDDPSPSGKPDVVHWLETQGICPEIHFYNVRSSDYPDQEREKALELILNELIAG